MNFKFFTLIIFFFSMFSWAQKDTPFKSPKIKLNWDVPVKTETIINILKQLDFNLIIKPCTL